MMSGACYLQVAAACLYIFCRQERKPFMLIDFSDALQVNVFMLGNVFLQLCKQLRLQQQEAFTRCAAASRHCLKLPGSGRPQVPWQEGGFSLTVLLPSGRWIPASICTALQIAWG